MTTILIIGLIIFAIVSIIIFYITRPILKAFLRFLGFASLIIFILMLLVFIDLNNYKNNIDTSENAFLLRENQTFIAGITSVGGEAVTFLSQEDIQSLNEGELPKNVYKTFIAELSIFEDIETVSLNGEFPLTTEDLLSDSNLEIVADVLNKGNVVKSSIDELIGETFSNDPAKLKAWAYGRMLESKSSEDAGFLIQGFIDGQVEIISESALFKFLKYTPESLIRKSGIVQ